jgi:lipopolysaccharide export system permease protein
MEQKEPNEMSIKELREHIRVLERQYVSTAKYSMEMYQRFTIPLASVVFALIGTPLGLQPQRSSSSIGLGLSIIIIFIYYAVMTLTMTLGKNDSMSPLLAALLPDILGFIVGMYLIRKFGK